MSATERVSEFSQLGDYGNVVPEGYAYYQKRVTPREDLRLPHAYFKWYDICPTDSEITAAQRSECRAFVAEESARLHLAQELGFILLHRAGPYLLLMIITWRNTNELWESVYVKEAGKAEGYTLTEFAGTHRGTYCVWELGPLWHERNAWTRFLSSKRDEQAKLVYINDRFDGLI